MKAIVTGASGHIGINLIKLLLHKNWNVCALLRRAAPHLESLPVEMKFGDLNDKRFLKEAVSGADAVFHLAGILPLQENDARNVWKVNVDGTAAVVDACRQVPGVKLIHCSTVHAFADTEETVLDESAVLVTDSGAPIYDRSKAAAQRIVLQAAADGLKSVVICPTGVIGPDDHKPSSVGRVVLQLMTGRMGALVAGGVNWVDVRDVALSMLNAFERAEPGEVFIVGGHYRKVTALAHNVCSEAQSRIPGFVCPMWLARLSAPFAEGWAYLRKQPPVFSRESLRALRTHQHMNLSKMKEVLGVVPRSFEETIHDTVVWHQQQKG